MSAPSCHLHAACLSHGPKSTDTGAPAPRTSYFAHARVTRIQSPPDERAYEKACREKLREAQASWLPSGACWLRQARAQAQAFSKAWGRAQVQYLTVASSQGRVAGAIWATFRRDYSIRRVLVRQVPGGVARPLLGRRVGNGAGRLNIAGPGPWQLRHQGFRALYPDRFDTATTARDRTCRCPPIPSTDRQVLLIRARFIYIRHQPRTPSSNPQ